MADGTWVVLVQEYGLAAAGISAIISAGIFIFRKVVKPMFTGFKQYNELCEKVDVIFQEVTPNGGTSIKDTIADMSTEITHVSEMQKAVLADTKEALFKTDSEGNCVWINRTYARTVGRTPSELMGHGWQNSIAEKDRDDVVNAWYDAVGENREFAMSFSFETPDGVLIPARVRSYQMTGPKGETIGYIGSIDLKPKD